MVDFIFHIIDSIIACFTVNFSWKAIVGTYWFLFFVEFPRYYLLEIIVSIKWKLTYKSRRRKRELARWMLFLENPLITILAPGKNEGKHIYKLVRSLREQTFRNFEIIIVDDGSDDQTALICRDLEKAGYIDLFLRCGVRGGKASAANFGAYFAKGKYIIHLDADSSLDRDAIEKILLPFYYDDKIKGIGGCVKVRNADDTICTSLQALEYLKTILVGRMVTSQLDIYHTISGAFGAFDAQILKQIGYWDIGPGLDGDITQKIRKSGYKVYFAEDAICMTNVPTSWWALFRQRKRWSKSLIRFRVRKHRDVFMPYANFSFFNFLSNMESVIYDSVFNFVWVVYLVGMLVRFPHKLPEVFFIGWIIRFFFSFIAFGVIMVISERSREEFHLIKYLFLSTFYTGWFLRITRLIAHTSELFFFSSYKDPWNPKKTSEYAQAEGM